MNYGRFEDYYEILGVSRNATFDNIKAAKRKLSKMYHPDLIEDEKLKVEYGAILARINNAADILMDERKRVEYDLEYDRRKKMEQEEKERQAQEQRKRAEQQNSYNFNDATYTKRQEYGQTWNEYDFTGRNQQRRTYNQYGTNGYNPNERTKQGERRHQTASMNRGKKASFFDDIKRAAREIKEDEVKAKRGARKAHRNVNDFVNKKFGKRESIPEEILYRFSKGTLHVFVSTLRELSKVRYITKDSLPKFVIRNRRGMAVGLSLFILMSGLGNLNEKDIPIPSMPDSSISMEYNEEENTQVDVDPEIKDNEVDVMFEQEQVTTYTIKQYHEVVYGDTLSGLAEKAGCSVATIQNANDMYSSTLIKIGETLTIPYTYSSEDIDYFTTEVKVPTGTTVREIAQQYKTDAATIILLNEGAIYQDNDRYYILSDTIKVPNFATQRDIADAKAAHEVYTKQQ